MLVEHSWQAASTHQLLLSPALTAHPSPGWMSVFCTARLSKAQEGRDLKCSSSFIIGDKGAEDASGVSLIG